MLVVIMPFVVACVLLFLLPTDKRFAYNFPKDNCMNQAGLLYDRMVLNKKPVDITFFGTSRTIDGVSDSLVEAHLIENGIDLSVMNMGYCRLGRNMPYVLLKELLKHKKPKYVVLEVTEKENWDGHMDFAYLAEGKDVLIPQLLFNDNIVQDMFKALVVRFEAVKQKWLGQYVSSQIDSRDYGHRVDHQTIDAGVARYQKENHVKNYKKASSFTRWFYYRVSFGYIDKFVELAKENNVEVFFLYLAQYASIDKPEEIEFYKERASVLIPPDSVYHKEQYWKDLDHMNHSGATALSKWLTDELLPVVKPQH